MENDRAEMPAPLAPHFLGPRHAPSLGRSMLTNWDNTGQGFRGLAHSVRPLLSSQWNGNTIFRSTRGLISKRTTRVGANVSLRGWLNSTLSDQSDHCAPSSSHAYHRRCGKTHSHRPEATMCY